MRKLTGYIGAMIIVFALMGSLLMGYALNVNGASTIVNEYEKVTDISGLYSYSEEKNYLEYNPASNYTGYTIPSEKYTNPTGAGTNTYIKIDTATIGIDTYKQVYINGSIHASVDQFPYFAVVSDKFYLYFENGNPTLYLYDGVRVVSSYGITSITKDGPDVTVTMNGNTYTYSDVNLLVARSNYDPDYYIWSTYSDGNNRDIYLNDIKQAIGLTRYPNLGLSYNGSWFSVHDNLGRTGSFDLFQTETDINNGVSVYTFGPNTPDSPYLLDSLVYPINIYSTPDSGILYNESNRVNNYPIETNPSDTDYERETVSLIGMSATDYWPTYSNGTPVSSWVLMYNKRIDQYYNFNDRLLTPQYSGPDFDDYTYYPIANHNYRLSDIISTLNIPDHTKLIKIDANGTGYYSTTMHYYTINIDNNMAGFSNANDYTLNNPVEYSNIYGEKDYVIYDPITGLASIYDYMGVKKSTNNPDDIMVTFVDNSGNNYSNGSARFANGTNGSWQVWGGSYAGRPDPYLNVRYTIVSDESLTYMDVTKGVMINPSNISDVTWDNGYENGDIKLLFRAEITTNTYNNTFTISNNEISINYNDNRYSVSLNGNEPVDIGTWRNIILDVDLINGKLYVIPVRTFNSYTNVQMDNSQIFIGDLTSAEPTNIINWDTSVNSFTFGVYSTDVFMDTYGVVMVNPSLDITNYFTDLNQFYRLNMYNFATYGDSITINGQTMTVSNGTIPISEDVNLELRNFNITYADGKVSIGDSHVNIDMGEITTTQVNMTGAWYFATDLERGYTTQKTIYTWDWGTFIFDNTQFCVFYLGFMAVSLIIARKFCNLSMIDYAVLITSIIIALGVQVIG